MRLVYEDNGKEVEVGDVRETSGGDTVEVTYFRKPHKPSSSGKISVRHQLDGWTSEYYVSVIGAEWVEREDRIGFGRTLRVY